MPNIVIPCTRCRYLLEFRPVDSLVVCPCGCALPDEIRRRSDSGFFGRLFWRKKRIAAPAGRINSGERSVT